MSFGNVNLRDDSEERERAARARFASESLSAAWTDLTTPTLLPYAIFTPTIMGDDTTMSENATVDVDTIMRAYNQAYVNCLTRYQSENASEQFIASIPRLLQAPDYTQLGIVSPFDLRISTIGDVGGIWGTIAAALEAPAVRISGFPEDPVIEWRDYKVQAATEAIESSLPDFEYPRDVKLRLKELVAIATEEYPETDIPSQVALAAFGRFACELGPQAAAPRLSLTPAGDLVAEWGAIDGKRAALQFLPDSTVNFSARIPDEAKGGRPMPTYGATSLSGLRHRLRGDSAFSWIFEETAARDTAADPG